MMDAILGLAHFCESHGPCVILSTQRCREEPQRFSHNLAVPWCEACQSIDLDQSLISKDNNVCYVTTRTPLQQDVAFLLKQAAVRSLSCEETSKEGGTMYFGDNERGHVLSHTFSLQDSLARGFYRKYSILILTRDKIHLLNSWSILTKNIKQISSELQIKADKINNVEQAQCSQRVVRQAQGSPSSPARSLSQLTGEPTVFAQLHMWFTWLLSIQTVVEKPYKPPPIPVSTAPMNLKLLCQQMDDDVFRKILYCVLTGIQVQADEEEVLNSFRQILPNDFELSKSGDCCKMKRIENRWTIEWSGNLPTKVPKLQTLIEQALKNNNLPESGLKPHIDSLILHWFNIAKTVSWTNVPQPKLLESLGVQKFDWPLLAYWTSQYRKLTNKES